MIPKIPVYRRTLNNGLEIMVLPDKRLPVMNQYTFYRVGSRNESSGITGISHLFEHMMFQGSRNHKPGEFDSLLESHGGYSNAYTTTDMTVYYETFPPGITGMAMELNSDRMGWLDLSAENLQSEREVVKEERRMRTENSNAGILDELLYATAFVAHPYRWPIIGWMDDIAGISLDDCNAYYRKYYAPNNAVLVLSGYCVPEEIFEMAEQYYGGIPRGDRPDLRITAEPEQKGERRAVHHKNTQVESCMLGFKAPGIASPDIYALDMLQIILGEGESSRLHKKLVYEDEIAADVQVDFEWRCDPSLLTVFVQMNPGERAAGAVRTVMREIRALIDRGVEEMELEKARSIILTSLVRGMKTSGGRANRMGIVELLFGDCGKLYEIFENYRKVDIESVRAAAERCLNPRSGNTVFLLPETEETPF